MGFAGPRDPTRTSEARRDAAVDTRADMGDAAALKPRRSSSSGDPSALRVVGWTRLAGRSGLEMTPLRGPRLLAVPSEAPTLPLVGRVGNRGQQYRPRFPGRG